jgi:hypothetical protein
MLWRSAFRWKSWPRRVTGDSAYGTVENIAATEKAGIRAYMALKGAGQGRPSGTPLRDAPQGRPFFGKDEFTYDPPYDPQRDLSFTPARQGSSWCRECATWQGA